MKNYKYYVLCGLMVFIAGACKKDNGGDIDPKNIPFEEQSKEQQFETLTTYLQNFAGKKYQLRYRITYDQSGNYVEQDDPSECESEIYIVMPEKLNAEQFISQIPTNESCGIYTDNSIPFSVFDSPFKNYRWEMHMFKIISDTNSEISFRGYVLIQPGVDINGPDVSDYLQVIEPFEEDLQAADRNPGTINARPFREYTFKRVN